jgi:hypothetical protein
MRMEREQRRVIVQPRTPPAVVEHDAQSTAEQLEQRHRAEEAARKATRPAPRRPDLDYDVKSGIQSERLNDALRHR